MSRQGRTIQLPRGSGARGRKSFLKLLSRVDPDAQNGFGFEGCLLKRGAFVSLAQLQPSDNYPEIPVILEYSVGPAEGIPGHRRAPGLYVLWRWQAENHQWQEVGRSASASWEWALDLRPLAIRALADGRGVSSPGENRANLAEIADTLTVFIDKQLNRLKPVERAQVMGILHDHFAARFCA